MLTAQQVTDLEVYLAHLRLKIDPALAQKYPIFAGKPYPLGRCKEVRNAIQDLLKAELAKEPVAAPLQPLKALLDSGLTLEPVWGSLRDEYFQNALVVGPWYLDAANDTVNPNKPRVEIRLLAESGFGAITSFEQFVKIARSYWEVDVYRNEIFPALAPFMPLVCVSHTGVSWFAAANDDMLLLARDSAFELVERVLPTLPAPPPALTDKWHSAAASVDMPSQLLKAQTRSAQAMCQHYRSEGKHQDILFRDEVVLAYLSLPVNVQV
ncbi:hypothetical protein [Pseudoalteromonas viridis]|uniref:Uncharacterized protein n=1 Tax=Pseudoalteromonas viridis TaxID=339617 RepID=A0ABX7V094_9GAMM|nr:hypothetical protein [Pseudoalteromonas viridis]QTL33850.1 hypothetical protein J5X90_09480 [Pseudoalteromonas viridis]